MDDLGGKTHHLRKHPSETLGFATLQKESLRSKILELVVLMVSFINDLDRILKRNKSRLLVV